MTLVDVGFHSLLVLHAGDATSLPVSLELFLTFSCCNLALEAASMLYLPFAPVESRMETLVVFIFNQELLEQLDLAACLNFNLL